MSTARAQDCAKQSRLLEFGSSFIDGKTVYHLSIADWGIGDCELRNVAIDFPLGGGIGTFQGEVATHFTHHKDVCTSVPLLAIGQWLGVDALLVGNPREAFCGSGSSFGHASYVPRKAPSWRS
jgi:hypothetical protein